MGKYSSYMTLGQIMGDPEMKAVVLRHMPDVESHPRYSEGLSYSFDTIKYEVGSDLRALIESVVADLNKL